MRLSLLRLAAAASTTAAALAASPPARAADAVYGGTTRDEHPIVIRAAASGQKVRSLVISWTATCPDGRFSDSSELTPTKAQPGFQPDADQLVVSRNANGRFAGTQIETLALDGRSAGVVVKVDGKLAAGKASGTMSAGVVIVDDSTGNVVASCKLSKTTWKATRSPGVIYGGRTSQLEPVVLRLNARRRVVTDMITAWDAKCTPDGSLRIPDHFYSFAIRSTGAFGAPFSNDVAMPGGGNAHLDFEVAGRVSKSAAKGSLKVDFASTDAAGTPAMTCDTGAVAWKATTG